MNVASIYTMVCFSASTIINSSGFKKLSRLQLAQLENVGASKDAEASGHQPGRKNADVILAK